jgi:GDP-4-dehydro-6-deoxy-D-mannose reductase
MRVLVTGAAGFVGRHLITELSAHGDEIIAFDVSFATVPQKSVTTISGDLLDADMLNRTIASTKPDACVHLGGISSPVQAQNDPGKMLSVNIVGTINLLNAFRESARDARILVVSTAHVYGPMEDEREITENDPLQPSSMYAISKAAADLTTLLYAKQHGMKTITARPNNHIGPGQSPDFVIASLARQIKLSTANSKGKVVAGNMESVRDFTDVRDVVRAYRLLLAKGHPGNAYNISSRNMHTIREVFDQMCKIAGTKPEVVVDPAKFRPTDSSPLLDITRIRTDTGWKPEIALTTTLTDILAEFQPT